MDADTTYTHPTCNSPETVMISGLGPSKHELVEALASHHMVDNPWDELWTLNKGLAVFPNADITFIMDDIVDYATRYPIYGTQMRGYRGHIIGQTAFPTDIKYTPYPLQEILNFWGHSASDWLHTISVGYVLAYAGAIGVKKLMLAGVDCSWPTDPGLTEAGSAVVYYWLGRLEQLGVTVEIASTSVLNCTNRRGAYDFRKYYGYLRDPETWKYSAAPEGQP